MSSVISAARPKAPAVGIRVYVRNFAVGTTEESVRTAFSRAGRVREVRVIVNRQTGRPRGFAFVTMGSAEEATRAIKAMNGTLLAGRPLRVSLAADRKAERASR
jgi:RNA recognition motif-containing protein